VERPDEFDFNIYLIGISILGTGCNGAYIEQIGKIKKWKDQGDVVADEMIINMEFGAFDKERAILPLTMFDNKLDRKSVVCADEETKRSCTTTRSHASAPTHSLIRLPPDHPLLFIVSIRTPTAKSSKR
jgi:hypothetical protein